MIRDRDQPPLPESLDAAIAGFLDQPFITWIELDLPLAKEARRLAREHGLRPPDAVHLASAIRAGCDELLIWDDKVPKRAVEGVVITEPYWHGQQDLGLIQ